MIREQDVPVSNAQTSPTSAEGRRRLNDLVERLTQQQLRLERQLEKAEAATLRGLRRWEKLRGQYKRLCKRRQKAVEQLPPGKRGAK